MSVVVLVGAPGAGKSTVGRQLAARRQVPFIDVDAVIEARAGKPIAEIFADEGEPAFRTMERDVTLEVLDADAVVSLGGGAVLDPDIRNALADHTVVWLDVSVTQSSRRVGMNKARPLLLGNVRGRLIELLRQRTPLYEAVATHRVDTNDATAPQVVARIEELLG